MYKQTSFPFKGLEKEFARAFNFPISKSTAVHVPNVNVIYVPDERYDIQLEVPGYEKDKLNITSTKTTLTITGTRTRLIGDITPNVNEISNSTSFTKSVTLSSNCNVNEITARLENGILYVSIPINKDAFRKTEIQIQ